MKQCGKHLIFLLFLLALPDFVHANEKTIQMACTHFPPYKIEALDNPDEPHRGIDLDVMRSVFEVTGDNVDFNFYPWKRSVEMVKRQQADGLCGCSYHPSRETDFLFSDGIGHLSQGIFIKETSPLNSVTTLDQLNGLTIGVVRGYAIAKELLTQKNITINEANNNSQLLSLLNAERVDAIYSYRDTILYQMSLNSDAKKIRYFELSSQPYYLCFSRNKPGIEEIVDRFNKGLRMIHYNGTYQKIWEKYR